MCQREYVYVVSEEEARAALNAGAATAETDEPGTWTPDTRLRLAGPRFRVCRWGPSDPVQGAALLP
jgi:hypothetical protein